jgi:nitrate/nitrite transporter NarK
VSSAEAPESADPAAKIYPRLPDGPPSRIIAVCAAGPPNAIVSWPSIWVMSLLYIGTFGSFIGFSFALPLVIRNTFT